MTGPPYWASWRSNWSCHSRSGTVFCSVIRQGSPTFGKWVGVNLSAKNRRLLYLPPTCAHGFCVISDVAEVIYKVSEEYSPEWERGICWNDTQLAIQWPVEGPTLSHRDQGWPAFANVVEMGIT